MKQIRIVYQGKESFQKELQDFRDNYGMNDASSMLFHIYSEILEEDVVNELCGILEQAFPEVSYIGCSTSGNLIDCQLSEEIIVVATIFEYESTKIKTFQYDLKEHTVDWITKRLTEEASENPWLKAIEMYFTIPEGSTTRFCDGLKDIRPDVQIFGGVSCSDDITSDASCVFSKTGGYSESAIIIVFYGGDDFFVDSIKITGWKPLGRKFLLRSQMDVF